MASNANSVADAIDEIVSDLVVDDATMLQVGHLATTLIVTRTKNGIDVDHKPFAPYSEDYARERAAHGLGTKPDLVRTGHMLGSLVPMATAPGEVTVAVTNPLEATKLAAHNFGVSSTVSVQPHRRSVYVDKKTGRRVSADEVRRDKRRKEKRVTGRQENVGTHSRNQRTPKREILDIRHPAEVEAVGALLVNGIATKVVGK